jgi:hypothetical protein
MRWLRAPRSTSERVKWTAVRPAPWSPARVSGGSHSETSPQFLSVRSPHNTYQAPGCQGTQKSRDARWLKRRWSRAHRSSSAPTFVSVDWFQALRLHQTPIGDLDRRFVAAPCPRNASVPSLVQSKSVGLFGPVGSGLERGAERVGGTPFGAPRMFGGEAGLQSSRSDAGRGADEVVACLAAERRSQISGSLSDLSFGLGPCSPSGTGSS